MDYILSTTSINNPKKLPLNELNLELKTFRKIRKLGDDEDLDKARDDLKKYYDVRIEKVSALNDRWLEKDRPYHLYHPYYPEVPPEENDQFFTKNGQFLECIDFLLECTFQQFWCYVIHEPKVGLVLKSFVYNALPWYELASLDERALKLHSKMHEKVARVFGRLLTYRHSEKEYLHPVTVYKYLDESGLLNFAMTMRLCLLYGKTNNSLVDGIMSYYLEHNKTRCKEDCKWLIKQGNMVLETLSNELCSQKHDTSMNLMGIGHKPPQFDPCWYGDSILLLLDTVANLNAFLTVCTVAVESAVELDLPNCITNFYDKTFPTLYELLGVQKNLPFDWSDARTRIYGQMALARSELIGCFHVFVSLCIDDILQAHGDHVKQDECLERYIKLMTMALEEEHFIVDYHNSHEIDVQLQTIGDFYPELDKMRTNYIMQCMSTLPKLRDLKPALPTVPTVNGTDAPRLETVAEQKTVLTEEEIDAKIKNVSDTLPHLGDGFILQCLEVYGFDTVEVITAVLDDNLSPLLQDVPTNLIRIPPEPEPEQPILAYHGKKPTYEDTKDLLDDKSDMKHVKDFLHRAEPTAFDMYDDDFDDRYDYDDSNRTFKETKVEDPYEYMVNRFEAYDVVSDPSESSSDEGPAEIGKPRSFCTDPALARNQRDPRHNQAGQSRPKGDVAGKPKGQGQDKSVIHNRDKKTVNKGSRANHNRKGGAQWKRNKGMVPS